MTLEFIVGEIGLYLFACWIYNLAFGWTITIVVDSEPLDWWWGIPFGLLWPLSVFLLVYTVITGRDRIEVSLPKWLRSTNRDIM